MSNKENFKTIIDIVDGKGVILNEFSERIQSKYNLSPEEMENLGPLPTNKSSLEDRIEVEIKAKYMVNYQEESNGSGHYE